MKILILTTYFPPDTAIAAVRPYMFAKYLSNMGHSITVLRSGEINKRCENFFAPLTDVKIISYLGKSSPAEAYTRGEWSGISKETPSRIGFLPSFIRWPIAKFYHYLTRKRDGALRLERRFNCHKKQKTALDALKNENFDIVFSTAGEFENALAGIYAANLFSCPLIQDFRDPLASKTFHTRKEYRFLHDLQTRAINNADVCTFVSEGVLNDMCQGLTPEKTAVLYNGYEPVESVCDTTPYKGKLTFCYTGQIYKGMQDFSPLFKAIKTLACNGKVSSKNIRIHYAGNDFDSLLQQAQKFGMSEILENHGHITRSEAAQLQANSDIFTVLSWNTPSSKGVLTGKFYEGIRAKKPILSIISGNIPTSELSLLNDRFHYGFSYEICKKKEQFQDFCDFLESVYNEKMSSGKITYNQNPDLETFFRYDTLAKQLEALCLEAIRLKNSETGV